MSLYNSIVNGTCPIPISDDEVIDYEAKRRERDERIENTEKIENENDDLFELYQILFNFHYNTMTAGVVVCLT